MSKAFSLVELSIVLVILGLLVGGILAGQSLIRASELRSVSTEYARYKTALGAFRDKYFGIPGDLINAASFWPTSVNGNGDGNLWGTTNEYFKFWQHLALAGLIEGTYSGVAGPAGTDHGVIGSNIPPSRMSNSGWFAGYSGAGTHAGDAAAYAVNYGNFLLVGGGVSASTNSPPFTAIFRPEEAWNIDVKMDDGVPGTGTVVARYWSNACGTSGAATNLTAPYNLTNSSLQCVLYFVRTF